MGRRGDRGMGRRISYGLLALAGGIWAAASLARPHGLGDAMKGIEAARTPPGMVYVPGGWYVVGSDDEDADEDVRPSRRVFVPSFYIDRTEVTNAEFKRFRSTHGYPNGEDRLPVTNVTYAEALAYARWAGKRL